MLLTEKLKDVECASLVETTDGERGRDFITEIFKNLAKQ